MKCAILAHYTFQLQCNCTDQKEIHNAAHYQNSTIIFGIIFNIKNITDKSKTADLEMNKKQRSLYSEEYTYL